MNRLASAPAATKALLPARRFAAVGGAGGVRLITERGFDRGRDLAAALETAAASSPGC